MPLLSRVKVLIQQYLPANNAQPNVIDLSPQDAEEHRQNTLERPSDTIAGLRIRSRAATVTKADQAP